MITVKFFTESNVIKGFTVKGHSGLAERGADILCAAVSSACYMTVNTLTEVLKVNVKAEVNEDGYMKAVIQEANREAENLLRGFQIHISNLAKDYPKNLKVIYGGADNA